MIPSDDPASSVHVPPLSSLGSLGGTSWASFRRSLSPICSVNIVGDIRNFLLFPYHHQYEMFFLLFHSLIRMQFISFAFRNDLQNAIWLQAIWLAESIPFSVPFKSHCGTWVPLESYSLMVLSHVMGTPKWDWISMRTLKCSHLWEPLNRIKCAYYCTHTQIHKSVEQSIHMYI